MKIAPESDSVAVVLVGPFSPRIFHPLWLEARGLIGKQEAANARIALVHDELAQFSTARGIVLEAQPHRLLIQSDVVPDDVRDIAVGLLTGPLAGIPISAVGINRTVNFDTGSADRQHKIGLLLAPREPWGRWGERMAEDENMTNRSGMISLKMQQNRKEGEPDGFVQVRIEPSAKIRPTGIFIEVNNHYATPSTPPEAGDAAAALAVINEQWTTANACAEEIIDQIMDLASPEVSR